MGKESSSEYKYSDRELVEQIKENPYYQYFIGLPGYEYKAPFAPSLLFEFRKRLNEQVLAEINEMIAAYNAPDDPTDEDPDNSNSGDSGNTETTNCRDPYQTYILSCLSKSELR